MIFRQLFDARSSTYTYVLADESTREAVVIDPVFEQARRDQALLRELELGLVAVLETHVHADHVTGAWLLRERLGGTIVVADAANVDGADRTVVHGDVVTFGSHRLEARATPGHTDGCITWVLDDGAMAFTGDALLIRGTGRTDFQQGNAGTLYRSVHEQILSLPETCLIYPAHDYAGRTMTTVAEELAHNPRLGGDRSENDFVGYADNLGLPHPRQIDVAVPANLRCGAPDSYDASSDEPDWAPLRYNYAGIWEIDPEWVAEHRGAVHVIDVRSPAEYVGELGHVRGAELVPLGELVGRIDELPSDRPLVMVCRSGGRSAQATVLMRRHGRHDVANLTGGMLRWNAVGLPTA